MNAAGANIDDLVLAVRHTGAAGDWPGHTAIADAVTAIFGDSVIAGLAEAENLDKFAVAVTTSWVLLSTAEEYFAGVDLNFPEINPNAADGWGVSAAGKARLLLGVTEIYERPDVPAAVASLAAFIALSLDEHADRAIAVWSAGRDWFAAQRGEAAEPPGSPPGDQLFAEFGDPSWWREEHADALAKALEEIYPHCGEEAAERPAPEFHAEPFSADEDLFFRHIVTDRLCVLWTARSSAAMPWAPARHQVLLPFAGYVTARAAVDRTRDLAVLLGSISLAARKEALRRKRLLDWISQIPNSGQFARRLYRRGIFAAPILGALFALIGEVIPDWLAAFVATCGLIAVIRLASSARKSAHYTAMTYPAAKSLRAGVVLSALYCAGEAFSLWLQNGGGSAVPGLAASFVFGAAVLTLAVRYGAPFKVSRSVFLPDGAPDDLEDLVDELSDKLSEWVAARLESADSSWDELFKHRSSWAPSPLGRPQQALMASAEAVDLFRQLARANPAGFDPGFGAALHDYAWGLCQIDRPSEAAAFAAEAVQVRSRLVKSNPAYEPVLGSDLVLLGSLQSDAGRRDEALPTVQHAERIFRRLAQANAASYQVSLARSQAILGHILIQLGRTADGLACVEEAMRILRPLAPDDEDVCSLLAFALKAAGMILEEDERPEEGLVYAEEAMRILRALPQANWEYRSSLGRMIMLAARLRSAAGRPQEAVAGIDEAVRILRPMAQADPREYAMSFAAALRIQSQSLSAAGRPEEALTSLDETVRILRPLVEVDPSTVVPVLAEELESLRKVLDELGRADEGLAAGEEAVQLLRPAEASSPG